MIDRNHGLPVIRQCKILELARLTAYYTPKTTSPEYLALTRRMDELHLEYPFAGSRMLRDLLRNEGQTSSEFAGQLKANGIQISMDGKGCWRDNVFVERLWQTIKYDEVYLKAYESVSHAKANLGQFITFYNSRRPHQAFAGKTPDMIYFAGLPQEDLAA